MLITIVLATRGGGDKRHAGGESENPAISINVGHDGVLLLASGHFFIGQSSDYLNNSLFMRLMTVGPARTINVAGKMNSTSGKVILTLALAADSSAATCRLI